MPGEIEGAVLAGAKRAIGECMGGKPGEVALVVTDDAQLKLGYAFALAGRQLGLETVLLEMAARQRHGDEPPAVVGLALAQVDLALLVTRFSLTHTRARAEATKAGTRIASMPMLTEEIVRGPLTADYREVKRRSERLAEMLSEASGAVLITPAGTHLELNLSGRKGLADTGVLVEKGAFGNLPAGEALVAPLEDQAEGVLVLDGSLAGVGPLREPIRLRLERGRIMAVEGGEAARQLENLLSGADENAWKVAELGIGTNPGAELMGNPLVDEKVMGTAHIGFGDNSHMGGIQQSKIHIDGIVLSPTLVLDGRTVIEEGRHTWGC